LCRRVVSWLLVEGRVGGDAWRTVLGCVGHASCWLREAGLLVAVELNGGFRLEVLLDWEPAVADDAFQLVLVLGVLAADVVECE